MNFLADALSRLPQHESKSDPIVDSVFSPSQLGLTAVTRSQTSLHSMATGRGLQTRLEEDPEFQVLKLELQMVDGVYVKGGKLYVPKAAREKVFKLCHDS